MTRKVVRNTVLDGLVLTLALLVTGCGGVDKTFFAPLGGASSTSFSSTNGGAVCNPLGGGSGGGGTTAQNGLVSSLYYLPPNLPQYDQVAEYMANGTLINSSIFFSQIDVPTRMFDAGFYTQAGTELTDPSGNPLYEWFALHFTGSIGLTNSDPEGAYQFAVLSDDGSVFQVDQGSGYQVIVNDDGEHPTQMGCTTTQVTMHHGQQLPMIYDYFQGPRYDIALILLWRPWPKDPSQVNDPSCGTNGNNLFFDPSTTPSTPTATYQALLSRGWSVVPPQNFFLPANAGSNPCN